MAVRSRQLNGLIEMPPEPVRRLTVDEYHQMINLGILKEDDPFELLEGWLVPKLMRNPPHDLAVSLAEDEIGRRLPRGWFRRILGAVTTADSEPEPDVAIVRGKRRDYAAHHPQPPDMALVVEVSDATLQRDRTTKARIFARARVAVYWIISILDSQVEVYTDPTGPGRAPRYRQRRNYGRGEEVPLVLGGREVGQIPVDDLLP
jgi:Uma2 family endonuclease